jgi:hypothetical protein
MTTFRVENLQKIAAPNGGKPKADGLWNLYKTIQEGLKRTDEKKITADNFSYLELALACGVGSVFNHESVASDLRFYSEEIPVGKERNFFTESNPGLATNAFQVITNELISSKVIEGYNLDNGYIGDRLVQVMKAKMRNQRITGFRALNGPDEVLEGHPYTETGFTEKYVTTSEAKKGRIVSINEELIVFDQTGEINRRAMMVGDYIRQEREKTIVRGVLDKNNTVYRPKGQPTALYVAAHMNYIGTGGVTGFDSASPFQDVTDLDHVMTYRATKVVDDRVDGTPEPIGGLNGPQNVLLVPTALSGLAYDVLNGGIVRSPNGTNFATFATNSPGRARGMVGDILHSPYVDAESLVDWYYGNFQRQFVWTEIWPLQTFTQGKDSEAAFSNDVVMRVKARYYGGISATDTVYVTKVKGS